MNYLTGTVESLSPSLKPDKYRAIPRLHTSFPSSAYRLGYTRRQPHRKVKEDADRSALDSTSRKGSSLAIDQPTCLTPTYKAITGIAAKIEIRVKEIIGCVMLPLDKNPLLFSDPLMCQRYGEIRHMLSPLDLSIMLIFTVNDQLIVKF